MTVILVIFKKKWVYGQRCVWLQWIMEHFSVVSIDNAVLSVILMGLTSVVIIWYEVLLLFWYGLVFGPNWVSI